MAQAAKSVLGDRLGRGFLVTKEGHISPTAQRDLGNVFVLREAAHPIPDTRALSATTELLNWLADTPLDQRSLLILISGGTSSLLVAPTPPLTLEDLRQVHGSLLSSGLPIELMNVLRKHISQVKGGQLAEHCAAYGTLQQLVMVDICAPRLDSAEILSLVGSGPFVPDPTTAAAAQSILRRIQPALSSEVYARASQALHETPDRGRCQSVVLGSYQTLLEQADLLLGEHILRSTKWSPTVVGEVKTVAKQFAETAAEMQDRGLSGVLTASGEPTVRITVSAPGRGGRCQELAMHFARHIAGRHGLTLLAGSSDGTDGPTEDAGAVVDGATWPTLCRMLGPAVVEQMLNGHDSGSALAQIPGALLTTGPTGQNLNDLFLLQIEPR
jgi:glycerate 2-kinase